MDFLLIAFIAVCVAVGFLLMERVETKRQIAYRKILEAREHRATTKRDGRIVQRLGLYDAKFPPVDSGLYSKVTDLYDEAGLIAYAIPVEARDRHNMYWTRANFDDYELLTLWLEGIIEGPKQNLEVTP